MIDRRQFVGAMMAAGAASLPGGGWRPAHAMPPPETTTLKLAQFGSLCISPQYVAEQLLRAEGFTDVQYVKTTATDLYRDIGTGRVHMSLAFVAPAISRSRPAFRSCSWPFYALRLHEAGLIKSSPQKVIAQAADWRFLKELRKELKG
jgi:hypothetical protein